MVLRIYNNILDKVYKVKARSISAEFYPRNEYYGKIYDDVMAIFEGQQCIIEMQGTTIHDVIKEYMNSISISDRRRMIDYLEYLIELEQEEAKRKEEERKRKYVQTYSKR